jgi:hypothetical protein
VIDTAVGPHTTTNTAYTTLTDNPDVTATIGASGSAMVIISTRVQAEDEAQSAFMSFAVSGTGGSVASDARSVSVTNPFDNGSSNNPEGAALSAGATFVVTGLSAGSHTFTTQYRSTNSSSDATFTNRSITVIPLG